MDFAIRNVLEVDVILVVHGDVRGPSLVKRAQAEMRKGADNLWW